MGLTDVLGSVLLSRHALAALKAAKGRIMLVGSVAGVADHAGHIYSVTKRVVTALAERTSSPPRSSSPRGGRQHHGAAADRSAGLKRPIGPPRAMSFFR
jgi:NAD(P)-dependent dehydrogenase (short-subunit alcohol dehydrogenase family)